MWSLACIFFEVFTGGRLFEANDDLEHLWQFHQRLGAYPKDGAKLVKNACKFFDANGNLLPPRGRQAPSSSGSSSIRPLSEVLSSEPELCDLLSRMLRYEPQARLRADEAMKHPFLVGAELDVAGKRTAVHEEAAAVVAAPPIASHFTQAAPIPLATRPSSLDNAQKQIPVHAGPVCAPPAMTSIPMPQRVPYSAQPFRAPATLKALACAPYPVKSTWEIPAAGRPSHPRGREGTLAVGRLW